MNEISCPECGHPKIRHVRDGKDNICLLCFAFGKICRKAFVFKLSQREQEQAIKVSADMFPQYTKCAECFQEWIFHQGMLCPSGDTTFIPLLDCDLPYFRKDS